MGKGEKETIKQARERREKVGFAPRNKDVLIDIIDVKPRALGSGLIMPEGKDAVDLGFNNYWDHPFQAYIVAKGPGASEELVVGLKVAFRPPGNPVRDKGHTYALMSDYDIVGFLD